MSDKHSSSIYSTEMPATSRKRLAFQRAKKVGNAILDKIPEITISRAFFYGLFLFYHFFMLGMYLRGTSSDFVVRMYYINYLAMDISMLDLGIALVARCQETMRFLRMTCVPRFINFERGIAVHRLTGLFYVKFALIHTVGEYKGLKEVSKAFFSQEPYSTYLFKRLSGWTGHVLLVITILMVILSIGPIRRNHYELFITSHNVLFYITIPFLYIHGKGRGEIHKYVDGPLALYVVDKAWRYIRRIRGLAHVEWAKFYPYKVVEVRFSGPEFKFRHGQHVRVCDPSIAKIEWHPFTLISDPSDKTGYTIMFKINGDWTRKFAESLGAPRWVIDEVERDAELAAKKAAEAKRKRREKLPWNKKHTSASGSSSGNTENNSSFKSSFKTAAYDTASDSAPQEPYIVYGESNNLPSIRIDGPYTGTVEYASSYKQVILVAGGNGMNTMVSFLYDVINKLKKTKSDSVNTQQKIDLIWVVRKLESFSWYSELWNAIRESGVSINLHLYVTKHDSDEKDDDNKDAVDDITPKFSNSSENSIEEEEEGRLVQIPYNELGYARLGRPNLKEIIGNIAKESPRRRIGVFICGPGSLPKDASVASHYWGYRLLRKQRTWLEVHDEEF